MRVEITASGEIIVNPDSKPATLQISRPVHSNDTALVVAFKANGRMRFQRAEVGPPDSCGKGYRCFRIAN